MKKSYRIKRAKDFDLIFKMRNSFANKHFVIYKLETGQPHFRVGISVSKKLGNAVVRNRMKRMVRHILIHHQADLLRYDFVVIVRYGTQELAYSVAEQHLLCALKGAKIYQKGFSSEERQ